MNFILTPSLEQIALVKIAASLWGSDGVVANLISSNCSRIFTDHNSKEYNKIEDIIKAKVFQLPLAAPLRRKISGLIRPMGAQLLAWLNVHNSRLDAKSVKFYWTMHGTIDDKKTAEMLIEDESVKVLTCHEIANIFCLENEYTLWKKYNDGEASDHSLVSRIMFYLEKEFSQLDATMKIFCTILATTPFERAFRLSALSANEAATRYLLQKLSPEEKERTLVKTVVHLIGRHCEPSEEFTALYCRSYFTNVVCFILSIMTEKQQTEVFNQEPFNILICLLNWPWQCFFPEVLERVVARLSSSHLYNVLFQIHNKIQRKCDDYDYEHLFELVWQKSPSAFKDIWFYKTDLWTIINNFLLLKLEDMCMMMVKDILAIRGPAFIFHNIGRYICKRLILENVWHFFQFVIQKCILTEESLIEFKEMMKVYIIHPLFSAEKVKERESLWKMALEKITECIRFDKRCLEADEPSKRLCIRELEAGNT